MNIDPHSTVLRLYSVRGVYWQAVILRQQDGTLFVGCRYLQHGERQWGHTAVLPTATRSQTEQLIQWAEETANQVGAYLEAEVTIRCNLTRTQLLEYGF